MCLPPFSMELTLLHSEWPKLNGVLAVLSAIGLKSHNNDYYYYMEECAPLEANSFLYEYMYTALKGYVLYGSKQEVTKVVPLCEKMAEKHKVYLFTFNCMA